MPITLSFPACGIGIKMKEQCHKEQQVNVQLPQLFRMAILFISKQNTTDQWLHSSLFLTLQCQQEKLS